MMQIVYEFCDGLNFIYLLRDGGEYGGDGQRVEREECLELTIE